jgi:ArsR family transcriptional regulator
MKPDDFFGILSDPTRLRIAMLIQQEVEVCVCELTYALGESQPKVSRHLAVMRDAGVVEPRREGTWMHYRLDPALPDWASALLALTHQQVRELSPYIEDLEKLHEMNNRPERPCA